MKRHRVVGQSKRLGVTFVSEVEEPSPRPSLAQSVAQWVMLPFAMPNVTGS